MIKKVKNNWRTFSLYNFLFFFFLPIISFPQKIVVGRKDSLYIHGTLNKKDTAKFIYAIFLDQKGNTYDSAKVLGGLYTFSLPLRVTTRITLFKISPNTATEEAYKDKNLINILAAPGDIFISTRDSFNNSIIEGSKSQKAYDNLKLDNYQQKVSSLYKLFSINTTIQDSTTIQKRIDSLRGVITNIYIKYLSEHPDGAASPYIAYKLLGVGQLDMNEMGLVTKVYNNLNDAEQHSFFGTSIRRRIESYTVKVGDLAPDFILKDTLNRYISLQSFRGKFVLIDFWASWCSPCREKHPALLEVYNKFKDKNFAIVSISLDTDSLEWVNAIKHDKMLWTNISDLQRGGENRVSNAYKVSLLPANFLINDRGIIIAKDIFEKKLTDMLSKIL